MKKIPETLGLMGAWFLLAASLMIVLPGPGWAQAAGKAEPAQYYERPGREAAPFFTGDLEIRIRSQEGGLTSPGELVLVDPTGDITGYDPRGNYSYEEIPGGSYAREPVPGSPGLEEEVLYIRNPVNGPYSLRVIGVDYGTYVLRLRGRDRDRNTANVRFTNERIQPGEVHYFVVDYSNRGGARLNARRTRVAE